MGCPHTSSVEAPVLVDVEVDLKTPDLYAYARPSRACYDFDLGTPIAISSWTNWPSLEIWCAREMSGDSTAEDAWKLTVVTQALHWKRSKVTVRGRFVSAIYLLDRRELEENCEDGDELYGIVPWLPFTIRNKEYPKDLQSLVDQGTTDWTPDYAVTPDNGGLLWCTDKQGNVREYVPKDDGSGYEEVHGPLVQSVIAFWQVQP